jgi:hypothetical protein
MATVNKTIVNVLFINKIKLINTRIQQQLHTATNTLYEIVDTLEK